MTTRRKFLQNTALASAVAMAQPSFGFNILTKKPQANTGFVTILDKDNKVISSPGGETPQYLNGILQPTLQMANPVFNHGHDVCIDEDKSIYVCQWNANQTPPVKLTRV